MPASHDDRRNPFEDKGLARLAVDLLVTGVAERRSLTQVQSYLSYGLLARMRRLPEADAMQDLRAMILRDGMTPNLSSIKTRLDLNRGGDSEMESVAYYDRDFRPGVNHETVRIRLLFEDGAWHVDDWTRLG